jgi:hypothetical protein
MHIPCGIHKLYEKIAAQRGSSVAAVYLHAAEDWMNSHGYTEMQNHRDLFNN